MLLIVADDVHFDSLGAFGCEVADITPHLDDLSGEGLLFRHAYVNIAMCQPVRQLMMTSRYPHNSGGMRFEPIDDDVPTLQESLRAAGYLNGILGKTHHLAPASKFCWDYVQKGETLGFGRDKGKYFRCATEFFELARSSKKPFFLMANPHDAHRPFAGGVQEREAEEDYPPASRHYEPEDVDVPGFLVDIPGIRDEIAAYYSSVHRCDEVVGEILRALEESGQEDNTLLMFLSDHGMAFPFSKFNCYMNSTRTPFIVRWPGKVRRGVDDRHMISTIDLMPTILDACGIEGPDGMEGRSFLPILEGETLSGWDQVYTVFNGIGRPLPIRSVLEKKYGYVYNAWADGKTKFSTGRLSTYPVRLMLDASANDGELRRRMRFYERRVVEELYDYENDPDALDNLIDEPRLAEQVRVMRAAMLARMGETNDPLLDTFEAYLRTR